MLNLRDKILISIAILTAFIIMTGITVAFGPNEEILNASWNVDRIEVEASQFQDDSGLKCYGIRYYQPNTFNELHIYDGEYPTADPLAEGPYGSSNSDGFYVVNEKFKGDNFLYNPWTEELTSPGNGWPKGEWNIVLLKSGAVSSVDDCKNPAELANSYRLDVIVDVPIPEFPTIALPIAAIIGIMFVLQSRKGKED